MQPSINGLTGKPGAGKSYFATRCIITEITKGKNRPIVTNVPINKKALRKYTKKDFYLFDLETFTDNKHFFTNRGSYHMKIPEAEGNINFSEYLEEEDQGVLYVIDEAHLYFNSRNWKYMSQSTICYITFIRHIGDTCIWMSQRFADIDSQFRGKTQSFYFLRNLNKERLGWFKRGSGFKYYKYESEHDIGLHGSSNAQPSVVESYPFEIKIAECYNTSLFNKNHETKHKVTGINLKYVFVSATLALVALIVWVWNGGLSSALKDLSPTVQTETVQTQIGSASILPVQDPFIEQVKSAYYEVPRYTFDNKNDNSDPFQYFDNATYNRYQSYWLGINRKCKLTFIAEKESSSKSTGISFKALWTNFAQINNVNLEFEKGVWKVQTHYFASFIDYVRDTGNGASLKEIDLTLKENVPFNLTHGFELPISSSITNQGVVSTQVEYLETGFTLDLIMESIQNNEMLKVHLVNTDAMDLSSDAPILQKFSSKNVLDVQDKMTYQIADFTSVTTDKTQGVFNKRSMTTELTNKIFISYGDY